jgi:hypothetical protein
VNIADLPIGSDWTGNGVKSLSLWFSGAPNNSAEQMYVKLSGVKVLYESDATNLNNAGWQPWNINLSDFTGVNLSNVTELSIGLERVGFSGGSGMVLFDDIRLYPYERQLITPTEPNVTGLMMHIGFDEGSGSTAGDNSGYGNHGTLNGDPKWVAGFVGGGLEFNGAADYVDCGANPSLDITDEITIAAWVKIDSFEDWDGIVTKGIDQSPYTMQIWGNGSLRFGANWGTPTGGVGGGNWNSTTEMTAGEWVHAAVTYDGSTIRFYIDGERDSSEVTEALTFGTVNESLTLGCDFPGGDEYFDGVMDDVRIYDYALSRAELGWLAGKTKPFDKPF